MCPVCSEYDICLIPVDGKGFGDQNVSEFTEGRPEWCPMKEQEAVEPKKGWFLNNLNIPEEHWFCGKCDEEIVGRGKYCVNCGKAVKWE